MATHIETNEVSIKDISSPSHSAGAFRPSAHMHLFMLSLVLGIKRYWPDRDKCKATVTAQDNGNIWNPASVTLLAVRFRKQS